MAIPEKYYFKDDGNIPNSTLPLLLYKTVFTETGANGATWLENRFAKNNWTNSWRNGIFGYHHYHSITHEVLGVYEGNALVHFGGENGSKIWVEAGDVIVIPAGVGHKKIESSADFALVGAYPNGSDYDILTGKPDERNYASSNISKVPTPELDPIFGLNGGLLKLWS